MRLVQPLTACRPVSALGGINRSDATLGEGTVCGKGLNKKDRNSEEKETRFKDNLRQRQTKSFDTTKKGNFAYQYTRQ